MTVKERRILSDMQQRTLFDLTQDGLVIGGKLQRIYPDFDTHTFIKDVRTEMEGQTIYNVTKAIGRVLRYHLPENYSEALAILMKYADGEISRCTDSLTQRRTPNQLETGLPLHQPLRIIGFRRLYGCLLQTR